MFAFLFWSGELELLRTAGRLMDDADAWGMPVDAEDCSGANGWLWWLDDDVATL